jgi:hypothetical protein
MERRDDFFMDISPAFFGLPDPARPTRCARACRHGIPRQAVLRLARNSSNC